MENDRQSSTLRRLTGAQRRAYRAGLKAAVARARLEQAVAEHREARRELAELVIQARGEGATYVAIADMLGITPQGAKAIAARAERA